MLVDTLTEQLVKVSAVYHILKNCCNLIIFDHSCTQRHDKEITELGKVLNDSKATLKVIYEIIFYCMRHSILFKQTCLNRGMTKPCSIRAQMRSQ